MLFLQAISNRLVIISSFHDILLRIGLLRVFGVREGILLLNW